MAGDFVDLIRDLAARGTSVEIEIQKLALATIPGC